MQPRRTPIPREVSARVVFDCDRTCCVCRKPGKPIQIHHIDGSPGNNDVRNLAVLCLECHHLTQLSGGFDRKLDSEQVILYRDDWVIRVNRRREGPEEASAVAAPRSPGDADDLELVTTLAEIYREREDWFQLALLYHRIRNDELRDKYLDRLLEVDKSDRALIRARRLQGRLQEVDSAVIERYLDELRKRENWTTLSRLLTDLRRPIEAAEVLLAGLQRTLKRGNSFTTAFYLKRAFLEGMVDELFVDALRKASDEGDLWWQIRALQELGWDSALADFIDEHAQELRDSDDRKLQILVAQHEGDEERVRELRTQGARRAPGEE